MKRRRRSIKAITMIELGVAGILLLLLVLLVYWYVDGLSAYKPGTATHQYFLGNEFTYDEGSVFRDGKDSLTATNGGSKSTMSDTPILYEGTTQLTIPTNMLLMVPSESTALYRINLFTTITEASGRVTFTSGKKTAQSYGGFMYDGEDLYILLEPSVLTIGNVTRELPALSYVKAIYGQIVEFHNSETDEDKVVGISDVDVMVTGQSGFRLNLLKDVIYTSSGEALLYSAVDSVGPIEMH